MHDSDSNNPWNDTRWDGSRADASALPTELPIYGTPASAPTPPPVPPPMPAPDPGSHAPAFDDSVLSGTYGSNAPVAPPVDAPGGGSRFAWFAAISGALVLLLGGGWFSLTALGSSGGAESPEAAVDEMLAALGNEDFLTVGELLEPSERRTLVEPLVTDVLPELIRIGVLDDSADAADVDGIDIEFADVTYRIDTVPGAPDLAHVWFTGGSATTSSTGADLPLGEEFREAIGEVPDEPATTEPINEADTPLVVVERDGRWYVSMWYSVAEAARLEAGESFPIVSGPAPNGADSPEAAVETMFQELADFDLEGLIATMDPEEASALYRYSPLFLDDAQAALDDAEASLRDAGARWSLTDMEFDVDQDGDDAVVTLRAFTFTVETPDVDVVASYSPSEIRVEVDGVVDGERFDVVASFTPTRWSVEGRAAGEPFEGQLDIDAPARTARLTATFEGETVVGSVILDEAGECSDYQFTGPDTNEFGCLEQLLVDEAGVSDGELELFTSQLVDIMDGLPDEFGGLPLVAHETDGQWYVSPTLSMMRGVTAGLESVDDEDFDRFLEQIEENGGFTDPILGLPDAIDDIANVGDDVGRVTIGDDPFVPDEDPFGPPEQSTFTISPTVDTITTYADNLPEGNHEHVYLLEVGDTQSVGVEVRGGDGFGGLGDPVLTVLTPEGFYHDSNDDFDGLDSGLVFSPSDSGQWQLVVSGLDSFGGDYELIVEILDDGAAHAVGVSDFDDGTDAIDDVASGSAEIDDVEFAIYDGAPIVGSSSIDDGFFDIWMITGLEPGAEYMVTVEASDTLDPNVIVRDPESFGVIVENDDAPFDSGLGLLDSQAVFAATTSGEVMVEVHSFLDMGSGDYTVTVVSGG